MHTAQCEFRHIAADRKLFGIAEREDHKEFGDDFPSVVASTWLELLYDVVKAEKTTPPAASQIYGITEVYLRTAFGG